MTFEETPSLPQKALIARHNLCTHGIENLGMAWRQGKLFLKLSFSLTKEGEPIPFCCSFHDEWACGPI